MAIQISLFAGISRPAMPKSFPYHPDLTFAQMETSLAT
jgi:hypothetical protein